jgi:hypothetical protein
MAGGVLTAELAGFCQSGVSVIVGSRGGEGRPIAGLALACTINASGTVRLLLRGPANTGLLQALRDGAGIAVTFSEPRTHRSIQFKGTGARLVPGLPEDARAVARQSAIFRDELVSAGYPPVFASFYCAYRDEEIAAVEFTPEQAFVQTPGPGAGSALSP